MSTVNQTEWANEFKKVSDTPPTPGDILCAYDDSASVKLSVELTTGQSPFIFARAYVPDLFGLELGWYLQSGESNTYHGWKCILLPKARTALIQREGLPGEVDGEITILVKSLKMIRLSNSGGALLCEVHEYLEKQVATPPVEPEEEEENEKNEIS